LARGPPGCLLENSTATVLGLTVLIFTLARTGRGARAAPAVRAYIGAAC
jgi:hypothetical protein